MWLVINNVCMTSFRFHQMNVHEIYDLNNLSLTCTIGANIGY